MATRIKGPFDTIKTTPEMGIEIGENAREILNRSINFIFHGQDITPEKINRIYKNFQILYFDPDRDLSDTIYR